MKKTLALDDEERSDESLNIDQDFPSALAVMDLQEGEPDTYADDEPAEWTGPRCDQCEAPMKAGTVTICCQCG